MKKLGAVLFAALLVVAGCSGGDDNGSDSGTTDESAPTDGSGTSAGGTDAEAAAADDPYDGYTSELYTDPAVWLCRPDLADSVCDDDLTATAIAADGSTEVVEHLPADDPAIDCFYVYPTISDDVGQQSDLEPTEFEAGAVRNQAARLNEVCEVYAPVYRQIPLSGITGGTEVSPEAREGAYADVLDAWKQYISHDNGGRGVVLVGHSQGSGHLTRLMQEEIDGTPLQDRLVSALLLGSSVAVPEGQQVGDTFEDIPLCTAPDQTGCVVTYASYSSEEGPGSEGIFGQPREGDGVSGCTNPVALDGGSGVSTPYFVATDVELPPGVDTPYVTYPDFITLECVEADDHRFLEVTVDADPADARTDEIPGGFLPGWGLHVVDANVAMGDLVSLVQQQADAFAGG
jgi:hypothetical protein